MGLKKLPVAVVPDLQVHGNSGMQLEHQHPRRCDDCTAVHAPEPEGNGDLGDSPDSYVSPARANGRACRTPSAMTCPSAPTPSSSINSVVLRTEPRTGTGTGTLARTSTSTSTSTTCVARAASSLPAAGDDHHHHMLHEQQAPPPPPPPAVAAAPPPVPSAPSPPPSNHDDDGDDVRDVEVTTFRDIHPLTPDVPTPPPARTRSWDTASHRSFSSEEQFMTMSREFTAMVAAGATMQTGPGGANGGYDADQLTSIGEDELEETNPLAIVPDSHPIAATPARSRASAAGSTSGLEVVPAPQQPVHVEASQVKKEEVETKVSAWQTAEVAKINNRFKREEVVINGWETEQVEKASAWLKKIERKLDEQRAKAVEKTQNDIAKARRKAEEKRASAEAKRGLKLAKVLDLANFMKAVGRVPTKRSFF